MKKPYRSIQRKMSLYLLGSIVVVMVFFAIVSSLVERVAYERFVERGLRQAAESKRANNHKHEMELGIEDEGFFMEDDLLIAHFFVTYEGGKPQLYLDAFTERLYQEKDQEAIITIAKMAAHKDIVFDRISEDDITYYFFIDRDGKNGAMVYYVSDRRHHQLLYVGLVACIILLVMVPFVMRFSKKMAKPIQDLELFAEEVARRNWDAKMPDVENDEIGQLAMGLDRMRVALEIAEQRDRRFLQAASHDLKTPIMLIKGYAQAILDGIHTGKPEESAQIIADEAGKLERRVLQLLHMNTLTQALDHQADWAVVRLDRMVRNLVERFELIGGGLTWDTILDEIEVYGNGNALMIAFENLFENQLRFAKQTIEIKLEAVENQCRLTIANDGPLFDMDDPNQLFDPYRKGVEGQFGLGLAIVRQVAEGHQGQVQAKNGDRGVIFEMVLPIYDEPQD